jgi:predicted adenine nucleotide alpha hydrolase (AANH) superfamily ATPase
MKKNKKSLAQRDKTYAQRIHFKNRVLERYGLNVNRHLYKEMVDLMKRGKGVFIEKQSSRTSVYFLYLEGKEAQEAAAVGTKIKVVYDNKRKTLVTALPMEDAKEKID